MEQFLGLAAFVLLMAGQVFAVIAVHSVRSTDSLPVRQAAEAERFAAGGDAKVWNTWLMA